METRQSRMDKYFELESNENGHNNNHEEKPVFSSRLQRNQQLYKEVSSLEIEGFDLNSNSTVLDVNASDIDLDDIKEQLEEKYHESPRNKSFGDTDEINLPKINLDETREYDINAILEKAKENKEINYEEDRHRKVNDVLKNIEEYTKKVKKDSSDDELSNTGMSKENEEELRELIDTINAKELIEEEGSLELTGDMDPLDLLSDLKGDDDNTIVMGQLSDELELQDDTDELTTEEIEKISELSKEENEDTEEIEEVTDDTSEVSDDTQETEEISVDEETKEQTILDDTEEIPVKKKKTKKDKKNKKKDKEIENLDNSFIGKTTTFSQDDFDEFDDLKEDMKATKIIIKILIIIIVLVFIAGLVILANSKFNWGLF